MSHVSRFIVVLLSAVILAAVLPAAAGAQRRGVRRPPAPPPPGVVLRGQVFVGGYFYDPVFGPYPWWPRGAYPHGYFPIYDDRANLRVRVSPKEADVYVDGFYAGIVDDFDGVFQGLPLPPGGHSIVLFLDGYRTSRHNLYLRPASTYKLHHTMERLAEGETSERPPLAPPVPAPPSGSYRHPRTPPRVPIPPVQAPSVTTPTGLGTLELHVQPVAAEVLIDGQQWISSDPGYFVVQVPEGKHRVEISLRGHRSFSTEIEVRDGETRPLNVTLAVAPS